MPGCVHTDLLAARLIPDPYYGQNELELQWIGENDWRYQCAFEVSADRLVSIQPHGDALFAHLVNATDEL